MSTKSELNMSLIPDHQSGRVVDAESFIELRSEKVATVFYEVVRNRLQHVNSWSIIANGSSARFQLVNKEGIEVYRKAQEGDYLKMEVSSPSDNAGNRFGWFRIEAVDNFANNNGLESFGFRIRPAFSPSYGKNFSHSPDELTNTFIVSRVGNRVTASIFQRGGDTSRGLTSPVNGDQNGGIAMTRLSYVEWKNLTDGLINRDHY